MTFREKTAEASGRAESLVCVGLDTDPARIPSHLPSGDEGVLAFNEAVIDATRDLVCAYKPNSAFYEARGCAGIDALIRTVEMVPAKVPVILDIKRGDIGNTAEKYAEYAYDVIGADAVTVNPYMGFDGIRPFLREGKCVFVLCLTSNASVGDFQMLETGGRPLYEVLAEQAVEWSKEGEIGLVVGATRKGLMRRIRDIAGDMPFLVPGIGAQGGNAAAVIEECGGTGGEVIINSSRGILYASSDRDYAEAARKSLVCLRNELNTYRNPDV